MEITQEFLDQNEFWPDDNGAYTRTFVPCRSYWDAGSEIEYVFVVYNDGIKIFYASSDGVELSRDIVCDSTVYTQEEFLTLIHMYLERFEVSERLRLVPL